MLHRTTTAWSNAAASVRSLSALVRPSATRTAIASVPRSLRPGELMCTWPSTRHVLSHAPSCAVADVIPMWRAGAVPPTSCGDPQ